LRLALADCALASYAEFGDKARVLSQAAEAFAVQPGAAEKAAAQQAWRDAMASWQRAEPFRFGPAAGSMEPGGQNLRDEIYAFPLTNYCRVDQQLVDRVYAAPEFSSSLSNARGLGAIEYLLFTSSPGNACSSAININQSGSWAALTQPDVAQRRADYAAAAARDVLGRAEALLAAWSPGQGDFHAQFTGVASTLFSSEQRAFNTVSDALLYVERELKDWKLGWPLGLVPECVNAPSPCPTEVESRYAHVSTDHIRQNLVGFQRAFAGCAGSGAGLGFDDWLAAVGSTDLSSRMLSALSESQLAVDNLTLPLEQALQTDPGQVLALHARVKSLTDLLKTEFITVLDFELPMGLEGDND